MLSVGASFDNDPVISISRVDGGLDGVAVVDVDGPARIRGDEANEPDQGHADCCQDKWSSGKRSHFSGRRVVNSVLFDLCVLCLIV